VLWACFRPPTVQEEAELLNDFSELYQILSLIWLCKIAIYKQKRLRKRMKKVCLRSFLMCLIYDKKVGGKFSLSRPYALRFWPVFSVHCVQGFSITVLVRITILVTFPSSRFTHTDAWPVVPLSSITTALVAFIVTVPSPSTVALMIGLTAVTL